MCVTRRQGSSHDLPLYFVQVWGQTFKFANVSSAMSIKLEVRAPCLGPAGMRGSYMGGRAEGMPMRWAQGHTHIPVEMTLAMQEHSHHMHDA